MRLILQPQYYSSNAVAMTTALGPNHAASTSPSLRSLVFQHESRPYHRAAGLTEDLVDVTR